MIELNEAGYSYGGSALLSGMSLRLAPGSFHFLTGPSGSGKTTRLRLCYGELLATEGQVTLFGQDAATMGRDEIALARRKIGVVHQDCQFLDHLNLAENIALPVSVAGQDHAASADNLAQLLDWVGLGHRLDALPPELSGGERQRAALARAVMLDPAVILADEPTGNIDWQMSDRLLSLLIQLNKLGKTVLIATHDLALIRATKGQVAARVLRIQGGTLSLAGADL